MSPLTPLEADFIDSLKSPQPVRPIPNDANPRNFPPKSGLDPEDMFVYGELRDDFAILQQEYFDRFRPCTPEERFQVDSLIRSEWSLRRLFRVESHLWEYHAMCSDRSSGVPLGEGFTKASEVFMRLQRRVSASERTYKEAYKELGRLQGMRTSASAPASGAGASACQPQTSTQPEPQPHEAQAPPQRQPTDNKTAASGSSFRSTQPPRRARSAVASTVIPNLSSDPPPETAAAP